MQITKHGATFPCHIPFVAHFRQAVSLFGWAWPHPFPGCAGEGGREGNGLEESRAFAGML